MDDNLIELITKIAKQVTEKPINQLRIEEELLIALAQNPNQPMRRKAEALSRVSQINEKQLKLLGANLGHRIVRKKSDVA